MTGITDRMDLGYFPLQDHEKGVPVSIRQSLGGARIERMKDPKDSSSAEESMIEYGRDNGMGTLGDVHPWMFWQTRDRAKRGMGAWAQAFGAVVTAGGGRYAPKIQPVRDGKYTNDTRFKLVDVGYPKCFPRLPKGSMVLALPGTEESEQSENIYWADPRLVAPNAFGPGESGTLVCDLGPEGEFCMDDADEPGVGGRHARLQSLVRVIAVQGQIPLLSGKGNILALNHARSGEGLAGYGAVWGVLQGKGVRTGPITPRPGPITPTTRGPGDTVRMQGLGVGGELGIGGGQFGGGFEGPLATDEAKEPCDFGSFKTNHIGRHGVAFMAHVGAFGPLHAGGIADKHRIGRDRDGHPLNSGHISTNAYFFRDEEYDAPLMFEGDYVYPPPWPLTARTHLTYDPGMQHPWLSGARSGMWRWWTEVPYVAPDDEPPDDPPNPPTTPTTPPGPGGPGTPGTPGPITGGPGDKGGGGGRRGGGRGPITGGGGSAPTGPVPTPGRPTGGGPRPTPITPWPGYVPHVPQPYDPKKKKKKKEPTTPITPGLRGVIGNPPSGPLGNNSSPQEEERSLADIVPVGPLGGAGGGGTTEGARPIKLGARGQSPNGNLNPNTGERRGRTPGLVEFVGESADVQQLYSIFHPMQEGFGSMTFRPQLWVAGYPNFERNPHAPREMIKADEIVRPQTVTLRTWGAQNASGDWDYTTRPRLSRARGGVVAGGVIFTPPERELEDYFGIKSGLDVTVNPSAQSYVAFGQGVAMAFGEPETDGTMANSSIIIEQEDSNGSTDRALIVSQINTAGTKVEILRLYVAGSGTTPTITLTGNVTATGTVQGDGGFIDGGSGDSGIDASLSYLDGDAQTHNVTVSGGIITQWDIA